MSSASLKSDLPSLSPKTNKNLTPKTPKTEAIVILKALPNAKTSTNQPSSMNGKKKAIRSSKKPSNVSKRKRTLPSKPSSNLNKEIIKSSEHQRILSTKSSEEENVSGKIRRDFKRKRPNSTSSQNPQDKKTQNNSNRAKKLKPSEIASPKQDEHNKFTGIEQIVLEMQNRILNLEQKTILDEKKIESFKNALIEQRNDDMKRLLKENELLMRMDLLYLDYDPERICRLCLVLVDQKEHLTSIFWPAKNQSMLVSLIKYTTDVQIEPEDGMPLGICSDCLQHVQKSDWLKRRAQRSNVLIKKFVNMKKCLSENGNPSTSVIVDAKDQFFNDLLEEEAMHSFKIEDVFSLGTSAEDSCFTETIKEEPLDLSYEEYNYSSIQDTTVISVRREKLREPRKCKRCQTLFPNCWSYNSHKKYCNNTFQCSECSKKFWNNRLFSDHKRKNKYLCKSKESARHCYECSVTFRWKYQLLFHVVRHCNQTCRFCGEVNQSLEQLNRHIVEAHFCYR